MLSRPIISALRRPSITLYSHQRLHVLPVFREASTSAPVGSAPSSVPALDAKLMDLLAERNVKEADELFETMLTSRDPANRPSQSSWAILLRLYSHYPQWQDKVMLRLKQLEASDIRMSGSSLSALLMAALSARDLQYAGKLRDFFLSSNSIFVDEPLLEAVMTVYIRERRFKEATAFYEYALKQFRIRPNLRCIHHQLTALFSTRQWAKAAKLYADISSVYRIQPTNTTKTRMLRGYCDAGDFEKASSILAELTAEDMALCVLDLNLAIMSLLKINRKGGCELFAKCLERNFPVDAHCFSAVVLQSSCEEGFRLVEHAAQRRILDTPLLNSLLRNAFKEDSIKLVTKVLQLYPKYRIEMNRVTYKGLLQFSMQKDDGSGALDLLEEMNLKGFSDASDYVVAMQCFVTKELSMVERLFQELEQRSPEKVHDMAYCHLIRAYGFARRNKLSQAEQAYEKYMATHTSVAVTVTVAMIETFARCRSFKQASVLFEKLSRSQHSTPKFAGFAVCMALFEHPNESIRSQAYSAWLKLFPDHKPSQELASSYPHWATTPETKDGIATIRQLLVDADLLLGQK